MSHHIKHYLMVSMIVVMTGRYLHVTGARMPKLDNSYLIWMKDRNSLMQMTAAWVFKEKTGFAIKSLVQ